MEIKQIDKNKLFNINYSYPDILDERLQEKLFLKKEFNNYQIKHRPDINEYNDLYKYRLKKCRDFQLSEHQQLLSNFFNPDTPYKSLLLFHGLGTGKTCCALKIASKFYEQIKKYNTRIVILVKGPVLKQNWINEIKKNNGLCSNLNITDEDDKKIYELFDIMSFKSFHRRVLGEKIRNKDENTKSKYIKIETGDFLRNESINKIDKLDNTLLIIDEAHNITGNDWTNAVKKILRVSTNLKLLLLTGTPMKNSADDIISLIEIMNIANGNEHKIKPIFTGENHTLDFTNEGEKILKEEIKGKFSYLSGGDKYIFASRNDLGIIPNSLKFTKIIPCEFNDEQYNLYEEVIKENNNGLEKSSSDVCNFIFPILNNNKIELTYGKKGLQNLINILNENKKDLINELVKYINKRIDKKEYKLEYDKDLIYVNGNQITGKFLLKPYLKLFSPKFHNALTNILDLVENKKGPKTAFIYSNLVKIGINMFKEILLENGYIEFLENPTKTLMRSNDNTICYYCGISKKNHKSTTHDYSPASFILITGKQENDDLELDDNEDIKLYINKYFNHKDNYQGKFIKLILGSQVISEGYSFSNVSEVHILDVYYNFARVDQAVGRGIRTCSHFDIENELNPYPKVDIYKYCMINKKKPTSEEILYQKAEKKHVLIKYVERIIKNNAIDKLLFYESNNNNELNKENKNCIKLEYGKNYDKQIINNKDKENICPSVCDYMGCNYYSKEELDFINNKNNKIDVSTFTNNMIEYEIDRCIEIIKEMYLVKFVYNLNEIIDYIKNYYKNEVNEKLYDVYYIYKALDKLIPITDNDFNNYNINLRDKFNNLGYLIYTNNYYIFQKNNDTEDIPMYYREHNDLNINIPLSLSKYLNDTNEDYKKYINLIDKNIEEYDFISITDYYNNKEENNIVGIIDKNKNKSSSYNDIFKIRDKITIKTNLKRQTGLSNYTGAVCFNAYSYNELVNKLKKLGVKVNIPNNRLKRSRFELCNKIQDILLNLEKYNTDNKTYCIIPANHPIYEFPYNIHDRVKYIITQLTNKFPNISINVKKDKNKYYLSCLNKNYDKNIMIKYKFNLNGKLWERYIE